MAFIMCRACSSKVTVSTRPTSNSRCIVDAAPRVRGRPDVRARFFKFGGAANPNLEGKAGNDRSFYRDCDVDDYWNSMGYLAEEGGYERMEALLAKNHPCDVMLLLAADQNDTPKLEELLAAGADLRVKDLEGKTALQLAKKPDALQVLKTSEAKLATAA